MKEKGNNHSHSHESRYVIFIMISKAKVLINHLLTVKSVQRAIIQLICMSHISANNQEIIMTSMRVSAGIF